MAPNGSSAGFLSFCLNQRAQSFWPMQKSCNLLTVPSYPTMPFCGRFESLDQEMNSLMGRILDVNQIVQQLLDGGHPSSTEVRGCQDHLNSRY